MTKETISLVCGDKRVDALVDMEAFKINPLNELASATLAFRDFLFPSFRLEGIAEDLRGAGVSEDKIRELLEGKYTP